MTNFNDSSVSKEQWTHEAHLVMAIWYTQRFTAIEAIDIVRNKIIKLNEFHGTPNSDSQGYHETLTIFWLQNAEKYNIDNKHISINNICNSFIISKQGSRTYPLEYYDREIIFSKKARKYLVPSNKKIL